MKFALLPKLRGLGMAEVQRGTKGEGIESKIVECIEKEEDRNHGRSGSFVLTLVQFQIWRQPLIMFWVRASVIPIVS